MDMQMPSTDGVSATMMICSFAGPERLLPIIALTGNARSAQTLIQTLMERDDDSG
jgi:CheY-like chemotaxis protein